MLNPVALEILLNKEIDTSFARSKLWTFFAEKPSSKMDLIVTVCADAAG